MLQARSVSLAYRTRRGGIAALENINLQIRQGEFVSLLGASGCGKSSLLKLFAGLMPPSAGDLLLDGQPVAGPSPRLGIAFQRPTLMPWKTVLENTLVPARAQGRDLAASRSRAQALLATVGLDGFAQDYPRELSGGMQQRVGLVRMLVTAPDVLLMDEPFAALDAQNRVILQTELVRIWEETGKTLIYVTHSIEEALALGDRCVIMTAQPGRIKQIIDVPFPRPRDPLTLSASAEFGQLRLDIWRVLEEEVNRARAEEEK
jgi:NitT/TauT family transport system ATP-binding protein